MKVRWTPTARITYFNILDYLEEAWTENEVQVFVEEVEKVLVQIRNNPELFQASGTMKNIRKGFISKHTTLYYRIKPGRKELVLLTFWDNRQEPDKLAF
jgi:plasmid stabilization system protein ParE